jgi:predicted DNA-binding transcriptional regulator AlpA
MFEDGVFTKPELVKFVGLSPTQIDRLERAGKFPTRVYLSGDAPNSKVGWCRRTVVQWLNRRDPSGRGRPPSLKG